MTAHSLCVRQQLLCLVAIVLLVGLYLPAGVSYGASIMISWNPNSENDLSGYRVYYGTTSGQYITPIDVGNRTDYTLNGLTGGRRYFISLTAYDTSGNESARSVEASGLAVDTSATTSTAATSSTTTSPITTSTATTSLPAASTSIITTSLPASTSIGPTTTSTIPETTTTTTMPEEAPCDQAQRLVPISLEASSEFPRFFAKDNLIDGDPQTSWSILLSIFRPEASITLDLGNLKYISSLSMYASRIFGIDLLPSNIRLQTSNDNISWKTITSASGYTSLQPPYADSWLIGGEECRYLKVIITGRKGFFFFQLAQIAELEIYGCDTAEVSATHPADIQGETSDDYTTSTEVVPLTIEQQSSEGGAPTTPGKPMIQFSH